jgi:hypothetical protein
MITFKDYIAEVIKYDYEWDNDALGYHVTKNGERIKDGFHKAKSTFDRGDADAAAKKHAQKLKSDEIVADRKQREQDIQQNKPLSQLEKEWSELHRRKNTLDNKEFKRYSDLYGVVRKSLRDGSHHSLKEESMGEATIHSNKDGRIATRQTSYASSEPNSYKIVSKSGEHLASVNQMKDPKYNFKTTHWHVTWHKDEHWNNPNSFQHMSKLRDFVKQMNEEVVLQEMVLTSKLQPNSTHGPMNSNDLQKLIGKTKFNALTKHPYYKKHVGDYAAHSQLAHKVTVDNYGYPTIHSTSSFTYKNHHGKTIRKMLQTSMAKDGGKVHQSHLFHNEDNERHSEEYGGGPVWHYKDSLHNNET